MLYNKNNVRKTNDKKILHKVGKQWKVVSIALLMAIGGGAAVAATNNNANADVNANNTSVDQEAAELENNNYTPSSVSAPVSSAASASTKAPSSASYSYSNNPSLNNANASAASYHNKLDFDNAQTSYYGPIVNSYVKSINARFPEARNLQSDYNSASVSATGASKKAASYSAAYKNPSNQSLVSVMASKAGLTTSDFVDSVQYETSTMASAVSGESAETSAMGFVNSLVNDILSGDPSLSATNASNAARDAGANYKMALANSNVDSRNTSAISMANSKNNSALFNAQSVSQSASENAHIARGLASLDAYTTESAAQFASYGANSNGSFANSSAISSAVSALASSANSVIANGKVPAAYKLSVGSYDFATQNHDDADNMVTLISDTAALSAEASVSASADKVIASAKAYQSLHASDLVAASSVANSDSSAVASASNAYAMAKANNVISTTIANGVGKNKSNAIYYINYLLHGNIATVFDNVVYSLAANNNTDVNSNYNFGTQDLVDSITNSMAASASANVQNASATVNSDETLLSSLASDEASASDEVSAMDVISDAAKTNTTTLSSLANSASTIASDASENATNNNEVSDAVAFANDIQDVLGSAFSGITSGTVKSAMSNTSVANAFNNSSENANISHASYVSAYNSVATNGLLSDEIASAHAVNEDNDVNAENTGDMDNANEILGTTYASAAVSAFNSAALASGSAKGIDFSILTASNGAFNDYATAVRDAERSLDANPVSGGNHYAANTSANLTSAMSLAQSSANSTYAKQVSASAQYSANENVDVTLASYFASSYSNDASSEATLATSASSALSSYYVATANNSTFTTAFNTNNAAEAAKYGDHKLAYANGQFVYIHTPEFVTVLKNAQLHNSVLFNKKTVVRPVKKGEQFHVVGVHFDKVGTIRYVVDAGNNKTALLTANPAYVENTYITPNQDVNVTMKRDAAVHADKNFASKVIAHVNAGQKLSGHVVPTVANNGYHDYFFGVSRLEVNVTVGNKNVTGYVTTSDNYVAPIVNNGNNNGSAASNNAQPSKKSGQTVFFD